MSARAGKYLTKNANDQTHAHAPISGGQVVPWLRSGQSCDTRPLFPRTYTPQNIHTHTCSLLLINCDMTRKQVSAGSQQHQRMRSRINNTRRPGKTIKSVVPKKGAGAKKSKHSNSIVESLRKVRRPLQVYLRRSKSMESTKMRDGGVPKA